MDMEIVELERESDRDRLRERKRSAGKERGLGCGEGRCNVRPRAIDDVVRVFFLSGFSDFICYLFVLFFRKM